MGDDWRERLLQLAADKKAGEVEADIEAGRFSEALAQLGEPTTKESRRMATRCHLALLKEACADGRWTEAARHAERVRKLNGTDPALCTLMRDRLKLLRGTVPPLDGAPSIYTRQGIAWVSGNGHMLKVPVLGRYGTWGHKGELTDFVNLLKKAGEELDACEDYNRPAVINRIGHALLNVLRRCNYAQSADLIVPIPADPERFATRGYSQQAAIAVALSRYAAIPVYGDLLCKTRTTRDLRELSSAADRAKELAHSMGLTKNGASLVRNAVVLLVDDVVTYGTHFREAMRVLRVAGATDVLACALATSHDNIHPLP